MIWFVEFPSGLLLVVLLVLYGIVSSGHLLLFVGAVGGHRRCRLPVRPLVLGSPRQAPGGQARADGKSTCK